MSDLEAGASRCFDPRLQFDPDGTPRSRRFGDVYYQPGRGAEESRAVFVEGCGLPDAWRGRSRFVIVETGFGTGLNFLLTWDAWRATARPGQRLHYLAVEGYPLSPDELRAALAPWTALAPLARRLRRRYGHLTRGFERLHFDRDRVSLTLMIGDAAAVLQQLEAEVDAWYLDGFAPRRNPDMWSEAVFEQVARLSTSGAHLATYSTAGRVRRGLAAVGFDVRKAAGFGAKRERLVAVHRGQPRSLCPPWAAAPRAIEGPVTVLGGGVAGRGLARALARRGGEVVLIDAGGGASRNPAAMVMPRLEAGPGSAGRLFWAAYRYALRYYSDGEYWRPEGVLLLARGAAELERQRRIVEHWGMHGDDARLIDVGDGAALTGLELSAGGLWFAGGGRVDGRAAGAASIPGVEARPASAAALVCREPGWQPLDAAGAPLAPPAPTILATGADAGFSIPAALPLERWAGRASSITASDGSARLQANLVCGRYLSAAHDAGDGQQRHWLGAGFARLGSADSPAGNDRANLVALARAFPELAELREQPVLDHWDAVRCASPDRLPLAGPLVDAETFKARFGWLRHRARPRPGDSARPLEQRGLYGLLALGARGFTSAPLLGEWLASLLHGDPWPLERDLALSVHASRFLVRGLRRREL